MKCLWREDGKSDVQICKSSKQDCGLWCYHWLTLIWFLNADSTGTLWWAQTGRWHPSSLEPSAVTVWTAWTAPTSFRACWPDVPFRASYRWDRITNSVILTRCDAIEDTCALEKADWLSFYFICAWFFCQWKPLTRILTCHVYLGSVKALLCSHDCLQTFRNQWFGSIMWLTIDLSLCVSLHLELHVISEDGCPPCRPEDWGTGWFWEDL